MSQFVSAINCFFFGLIWVFPPINIHARYDFRWFQPSDMISVGSKHRICFWRFLFLTCVHLPSKSASPPEILPSLWLHQYLLLRLHLSGMRSPCVCLMLCFLSFTCLSFLFTWFYVRVSFSYGACVSRVWCVCLACFLFFFTCSSGCILFLLYSHNVISKVYTYTICSFFEKSMRGKFSWSNRQGEL